MKILFATTNPAKIVAYKEKLEQKGIEMLTLKDLNINLNVDENGKNAIENAYIKAKSYGDETGMMTIGMDNCLFIKGIPKEKQPGTHVRRVKGKCLTDEEMLEYYTNLAKEYGGKLSAEWIFGMVVYNQGEAKEYSWSKDKFYLVDKPCEKLTSGYPLDSMTIIPQFNKYLAELTPEEKAQRSDYNEDDVVEFICNAVKDQRYL